MRRDSPWLLASLRTKKAFTIGARRQGRAGDRIGAHRHATYRGRSPGHRLGGHQLAERQEALAQQDGALGVDQILGGDATGQHDLADHQRLLAQHAQQSLACLHLCLWLGH